MYWLFMLSILPTAAFASPSLGGFDPMSLLPIVLIFVVFYFLLLRPQQKKVKQHQEMLGNLRRGDKVVTSGGIIGSVNKIMSDQEVLVEIAENVRVRVLKGMITEVMTKGEPVSSESSSNVTPLPMAANKKEDKSSKSSTKAKNINPKKSK